MSSCRATNVKQNIRHADASGLRNPARGDALPWTRLSEEKVRAIRSSPSMSTEEKHRLAAEYGVTFYAICNVLNNKSWKWVK